MNITVLTFRITKATKYGKTKRPPLMLILLVLLLLLLLLLPPQLTYCCYYDGYCWQCDCNSTRGPQQ